MIHLAPDSILSRFLGADTICIAIKKKNFKNFDSTSIAIWYCCVTIKTHFRSHFSYFISVFSKHKQIPIEKYFLK